MQKVFKLSEIPQESKIYGICSDYSEFCIFKHLDGMFSYCVTENGNPVHISRNQPLVKFKDGYTIHTSVKY